MTSIYVRVSKFTINFYLLRVNWLPWEQQVPNIFWELDPPRNGWQLRTPDLCTHMKPPPLANKQHQQQIS